MKKILFAGSLFAGSALLTLATSNPLLAADLAFKAPWDPGFSWGGCYLGGQVGGGFMKDNIVGTDSEGSSSGGNNTSDPIFHGGGAIAGGQLGCNYQYRQAVFGIEGEGWWSNLTDRYTDNYTYTDNYLTYTYTESSTYQETLVNRWDMALSLRAGWAFDRLMLYGKAGIVWGKFNYSGTSNYMDSYSDSGISSLYGGSASASQVLPGMLIGFGIEYAFTNNWMARIEADYLNFAISNVNYTQNYWCSIACSDSTSSTSGAFSGWATKALLKVGLSYKFY